MKHPLPEIKKIPLTSIIGPCEWDLHPFPQPDTTSAAPPPAYAGLLRPPMVIGSGAETYRLLYGQDRLESFTRNYPQQDKIAVLIAPDTSSDPDFLQYILDDKTIDDTFSPMEKAYFFKHSLKYLSPEAAAESFLPQMGEKVQRHAVISYVQLTELEAPLQLDIHTGRILPKFGQDLLSLSSEDRMLLHMLFQQLGCGNGKQKRILSLAKDLAGKDGKSVSEVLAAGVYQEIINHPAMNPPQKTSSLISSLHRMMFPISSSAQDQFNRRVKRMALPQSCSVENSPFFEKNEVNLTITFPDLETLERQSEVIKSALTRNTSA